MCVQEGVYFIHFFASQKSGSARTHSAYSWNLGDRSDFSQLNINNFAQFSLKVRQ